MSKIREIFLDHWDEFAATHNVRETVCLEVEKMLGCGLIENGCTSYKCPNCDSERIVPFTCKSRFCTSCGQLYRKNWSDKLAIELLPSVHKHIVFTIPQELREEFRKDRNLLKELSDRAAKVMKEIIREMNKGESFLPGIITVIHTFGRDLKWNPHIHMIMSLKCYGETKNRTIRYFCYEKMRKFWQKEILDLMKEKSKSPKMRMLINRLYREKNNGFYIYAKGEISDIKIITNYVGRYVGRPAIAESRIVSYDGEYVEFRYTPHGETEEKIEKITALEFIKRLVIHIPESNFKMIRRYGLYSRNNIRKRRGIVNPNTVKLFKMRKNLRSWSGRMAMEFDEFPLKCECGSWMKKDDIILPKHGIKRRYKDAS